MTPPEPFHLFEAHGIELEYMIVDAETLAVRPVADELLAKVGGGYELEVERGPIAWSNELALHVVELKTNGPVPSLAGLAPTFQQHVGEVNELLESLGARLLPTAMHPWMDPHAEMRLWPHENNEIYRAFDRIFDCRGHGWANLQSMHINLPFAGDEEFARLHAAIRLVLPLLPALAASSPLMDGAPSGMLDSRLDVYRTNARAVPSVTGCVIPERVFTRRDYEQTLLGGIYRDLAAHEGSEVLCEEWVNARGAIARFDRMSIEIRVLDVQECPRADLAVAGAVVATVRALTQERWLSLSDQRQWDEQRLAAVLLDAIRDADECVVRDTELLHAFGFPESGPARLGDVWQHLVESVVADHPGYAEWKPALDTILHRGCLARRITRALGDDTSRPAQSRVYRELADCLARGELFVPQS